MDDFLVKPIQVNDMWLAIDRVANNHIPDDHSQSPLLSTDVLMAACGGDEVILEKICATFRASLPDHLREIQNALRAQDSVRLREAAHKLCGMVAAFSEGAGQVASQIEDLAAQGNLEENRPLIAKLEAMAHELLRVTERLSLESLQQQKCAATRF